MDRLRQERFERFIRLKYLELKNFEDNDEVWSEEEEEETNSTEVELENQPRNTPQKFEQREEDDKKMSTETRIIHKNESEAISRKEDEEDSTNFQAKEPLPKPTLQDSAEQQPEISVHSPDLQRLGTPTSHLQPETFIKTEKFNDSTEGVFETELQVEDKDSIVLDESIYNTEIQLENKKTFQRQDIDPESLEEETQEEMSAHYRRPGYPLDYPGCPGYPEEETALYFSNTRLEKIRERKYKDLSLIHI